MSDFESFQRFSGDAIPYGETGSDRRRTSRVFSWREFNELLEESLEQARRGEARPLDVEDLKSDIRRELAAEGIDC